MSRQRFIGIILFIITLLLVISGCSNSETVNLENKEPNKIHHKFLLYKEDYVNDDGESIGDLYIQSIDSEREKIASGVKQHDYDYVNDKGIVLFLDEEDNLYQFEEGKEKVKLAEDVYSFDGEHREDIITYENNEYDLYIIKDEKKEKIASDVDQNEIVGDIVYYSNHNGYLSQYNIETRQEVDLASNIYYFQILNADGDLFYVSDDELLYYKKAGEDSIKISTKEVDTYSVQYIDNQFIYTSYADGDSELFISKLSDSDVITDKIANDVSYADFDKGIIYYLTSEGGLYKRDPKDDAATRLANEVEYYELVNGTLYLTDEDLTLYKLEKSKDKEKIGSDVMYYHIHKNDVVYFNVNDDLFINDTKVVSGISDYSYYFGNLTYTTEEKKLYMMKDLKDPVVIFDDLSEYSTVYYQNQLTFNNTLGFIDIAGFWKTDSEYDAAFVEINKDGIFTDYMNQDSEKYEIDYAEYQSMDVSSDGEYLMITKINDQTLSVDDGYSDYMMTKSSKEDAEQYIQDALFQQDIEEVKDTISSYLHEFIYATYYDDTDDLHYYIDVDSSFYQQQVNYIEGVYDRNIEMEIIDYEFQDVKSIDKDTFEVIVLEEYSLYYWDDGSENTVNQTATYTLKRLDGSFYITDLNVS